MLTLAELKVCVAWYIYFLDILLIRRDPAKFHHIGYIWQILGRKTFLLPSVLEQPEMLSLSFDKNENVFTLRGAL